MRHAPAPLPSRCCASPADDFRFALLVPGSGVPVVVELAELGTTVVGPALFGEDEGEVVTRHAALRRVPAGIEVVPLAGPVWLAGRPLAARGAVAQPGQLLRFGRRPAALVRQESDGSVGFGELSSLSPIVWQTYAALALAADAELPVLLGGESGTGKELAARALHAASSRSLGPWQAVNCAALHGDTLLAELFGAARGAYTGATHDRQGAFERAHGGTLFLDEIGELSAAAQAALLRVLEVGEVQVLGGPVKRVDVRVVAATHRDLREEVAKGRFRLDLLYRLAVLEVRMPSLVERPEDLQRLLQRFMGDVPAPRGAAQLLRNHLPAGNLRGLRNLGQRLAVMCPSGQPSNDDLRSLLLGSAGPGAQQLNSQHRHATRTPSSAPRDPADRLAAVADVVARADSVCDAWRASGLPRGTFFRYWKRLRLDTLAAAA